MMIPVVRIERRERQARMRLSRVCRSLLTSEIGRCAGTDLVPAGLLIGTWFALVLGVGLQHDPHISLAAVVGVAAILVPVAWRRPWPLTAVAVMAAATGLNDLVFGAHVRCGVALPALFLVSYSVAVRCDRTRSAIGLLLALGSGAAEGLYDPRIELGGLVNLIVPLTI